jgi:hypothetical protein
MKIVSLTILSSLAIFAAASPLDGPFAIRC